MSKVLNFSPEKIIILTGGQDFNALVEPGTYQLLWYDGTAQNTPTGGNACQLVVARIAENVFLQTCTVWLGNQTFETYQRIRENGVWGEWAK